MTVLKTAITITIDSGKNNAALADPMFQGLDESKQQELAHELDWMFRLHPRHHCSTK